MLPHELTLPVETAPRLTINCFAKVQLSIWVWQKVWSLEVCLLT